MEVVKVLCVLACCFHLAEFVDPPCTIDLECEECIPDNMPLVTSHRAGAGAVRAAAGDEVVLACAGGKFLLYPFLDTLSVVCEAGRYRVRQDGVLRHLIELGCQENVFEDVLHDVEHCPSQHQGRAYEVQEAGSRITRHLATVCFNSDLGISIRSHVSNEPRNYMSLPPHAEKQHSPLSLLGNFNHMFDAKTRSDAEKLYSDDLRMNKRVHELFKHDKVTFADQILTSAKLLSSHYFEDQNMRVTDFVSNKVAVWKSVASGNLHHLHHDVSKFLKMARPHAIIDVYSGTHDVLSLRVGHERKQVYLKPGRFPVPKYIWTIVHDRQSNKAVAITLLNDPFIAVSEIRETVFCDSACGSITWLHELRRNRNYESPVSGLVFCCGVHNFTGLVNEMPKEILKNVPYGNSGILYDISGP